MFGRLLIVTLALLAAWVVLARPSSGSAPAHAYVVKPRDTLWTIAAREYGGDPRAGVWKLQQANHLQSTFLQVGERLVVP